MIKIKKVIEDKKDTILAKLDIGEIEPQTVVKIFNQETFFSVFAEQIVIYEKIYD